MKKIIKYINKWLGTDRKVLSLQRSLYKSLDLQRELHQEVKSIKAGYETLFDRNTNISNRLNNLEEYTHDNLKSDFKYKNKYCVVVGSRENLAELKVLPEIYNSEKVAWESLKDKYEKYEIMWVLKIQLAGIQKLI